LKSVSLNLLEHSGPVQPLRNCFTFSFYCTCRLP